MLSRLFVRPNVLHIVIATIYFLSAVGMDKVTVSIGLGCCYVVLFLWEKSSHNRRKLPIATTRRRAKSWMGRIR